MIITIGNIKGGVGKTTLAINFTIAQALLERDVLLIDGDEQHTAMTFTELRTEQMNNPGYTIVSLQGAALRTQVRQLTKKYDDIIIDVGGRDTGSLRAALTVSDVLFVPVQPRSFDIWAIDQVVDLIREAREINNLKAVMVINAADAQGRDNEEAAQVLQGIKDIELIPFSIGRRKAFPNAATHGRSVLEHLPKDGKAVDELTAVINYIFNSNKISV